MNATELAESSSRLYNLAREAMDVRRYELAIALLRSSTELYPHPKPMELLGECLLEIGRGQEAVVFLAASAGLGNKASRSLFLLGRALSLQGRTADAIEKLDLALEMQPQFKAALEFRTRLRESAAESERPT